MTQTVPRVIANTRQNIRRLGAPAEAEDEVKPVLREWHACFRRATRSEQRHLSCEAILLPPVTEFLDSMTVPAILGTTFSAQSPTALKRY